MGSSMKRNFDHRSNPKRVAKIKKIQNVWRQLGMHTLLINSMKEIYYRHNDHFAMFSAIIRFFESYYCYNCEANQISLLLHINYLLSLHQWDLDSPTLISQILKSKMKENEIGTKFFKFIVERVTQRNLYNAPLFNLIWVLSETDTKTLNNKMFVINKIIKQQKLREIMMDTEQAHKKIELIEIYQKKRRTLKENVILQEKDFLDAHIALVNLYAKWWTKWTAAILQVRKIVEVDSIYNNLFSEAVPYVFKRVYFRFFFEVYMRTLPDIRFVDINNDKFISMLTYVVLEDLKIYSQYLPGLLIATPEEEEKSIFDEAAQRKQNVK